MAAAVATWSFGLEAVKVASSALLRDQSSIEAIEMGINYIEEDHVTGVYLVGRGGYPNSDGIVQLDAAMMRGEDNGIGSVCAIEGVPNPISVARHVMKHSSANVLVGEGATNYARTNGFKIMTNEEMLTDKAKQLYKEFKENELANTTQGGGVHDTLSMVCLDRSGNICVGVSTSGRPFKPSGRVGDSPLPGCGFYASHSGGGAAATGNGELIMKYCPSFKIVDLMSSGCGPQDACKKVVKDILDREPGEIEMGVVALDMKGNHGACGSIKLWKDELSGISYNGFPYAVWRESGPLAVPTVMTYSGSL